MEDTPIKKPKRVKAVPKTKVVVDKQAKSSKAEVNQRVTEIQALIMSGYTRSYMLQYGSKWKISDRQIDDYIKMATTVIKEINQSTLQDNQAIITGQLWDLFRAARADANVAECHKILMSIAKLKGLDQHTVNHVIEDKRELSDMSNEQLDSILESANERH